MVGRGIATGIIGVDGNDGVVEEEVPSIRAIDLPVLAAVQLVVPGGVDERIAGTVGPACGGIVTAMPIRLAVDSILGDAR